MEAVELIITDIMKLHDEMKELTLASGVPVKYFEYAAVFDGLASPLEIKKVFDFLEKIRYDQYQRVLEIWRLIPPEMWQQYRNFGEENLREQLLLRERQKVLRTLWKTWYKDNHRGKEASDRQQEDHSKAAS